MSPPRRSFFLAVVLLLIAAVWGYARLQGMGLYGGDSVSRRLDSLLWLSGETSWKEALRTAIDVAENWGRISLVPQLAHSLFFYAVDPRAWWFCAYFSSVAALALFAWGFSCRLGGWLFSSLLFLTLISGFQLNLDAPIFALWPVYMWGLAAFGLGLWLDRPDAPRGGWLAAFFYGWVPLLGNEALLAPVLGLVVGRWIAYGPDLRGAAVRAPLRGTVLFCAAYIAFRLHYGSHYDGVKISLAHPFRSAHAWVNGTLSGLPDWDFGRLQVVRAGNFDHFLGLLAHRPLILSLVGFALFCGGTAAWLKRRDRFQPPAREEKALMIAMALGALLNFIPLAITDKYSQMFTSPLNGYYHIYSFYGYACICAGLTLGWRRIFPSHGGAGRAAIFFVGLFVFLNALASGLSSEYNLSEIRNQCARWRLWDRFIQDNAQVVPRQEKTVYVLLPLLAQTITTSWDICEQRELRGEEEEVGLDEYFKAQAVLDGVAPPSPVVFLHQIPAPSQRWGESYFYLLLRQAPNPPHPNSTVMGWARIAPGSTTENVSLSGPLWLWADGVAPRRLVVADKKIDLDWRAAGAGKPLRIDFPGTIPVAAIFIER